MSKKIFHKNLYLDQLRQLRLIGFIGLGLLSLMAILLPIGKAMSVASERAYEMSETVGRINLNIPETHFYLLLSFTILVPLLALSCFHYLTQRNSSDFYHSLPHTRTCVFTCNIAAVFTWSTLLVWVPTIISMIMYTILSKDFILDIPLLLRYSLFVYLACLLVVASISIACSITGTVFTNVVVSGMIIFLPRIFILAFTGIIAGSSHLFVSNRLFPLLDYQYNVILGTLGSLVSTDRPSSAPMGWGTVIYSIVLILIYLALGLLLYRKRKSETANQAAVSKRVQTVIRLVLGTTVSLIPISIIFNVMTYSRDLDSSERPIMIYSVCILYLVACLVMLLYELLTTKKFKNVVKALPSIAILAVINVVILVGAYGISKGFLSYRPDAEDIDYIVTCQQIESHETRYYDTLAGSIKVDDKKVLQLVSDCLKSNLDSGDNGANYSNGNIRDVTVGIHSGLTTHYRNLWMSEKDYNELRKSYSLTEDYKNAYMALPDLAGNKLSLTNMTMSDAEYLELYNIAKEEIKTLSFEDWYSTLCNGSYSALDSLVFYATVGTQSLRGIVPITGLLPKTYKKYFELSDKYQKEYQSSILTAIKQISAKDSTDNEASLGYYLGLQIFDMSQGFSGEYGLDDTAFSSQYFDPNAIAMHKEVFDSITTQSKDYASFNPKTDYVLKVTFSSNSDDYKRSNNKTYNFIIDKTKIKNFADFVGINQSTENYDEGEAIEIE